MLSRRAVRFLFQELDVRVGNVLREPSSQDGMELEIFVQSSERETPGINPSHAPKHMEDVVRRSVWLYGLAYQRECFRTVRQPEFVG